MTVLPSTWSSIPLSELSGRSPETVDPQRTPDELFALFSIPAYDSGRPELVRGRDIGSTKQAVKSRDVLLAKIVPHIRRSWVVNAQPHCAIASTEWIRIGPHTWIPIIFGGSSYPTASGTSFSKPSPGSAVPSCEQTQRVWPRYCCQRHQVPNSAALSRRSTLYPPGRSERNRTSTTSESLLRGRKQRCCPEPSVTPDAQFL